MRLLLTALSATLVMVLSPLAACPPSYAGDETVSAADGDPPALVLPADPARPTPVILVHGVPGIAGTCGPLAGAQDKGFCVFPSTTATGAPRTSPPRRTS